MAVSPSSSKKKKKQKSSNSKARTKTARTTDSWSSTHPQHSSKRRRNKSPGVRLVHGRIYDSENGKTCHQCRQKTMDFAASCKRKIEVKQCTIHFCHKCLLNRYGEKAEEVALLNDWTCPRCRGICNCSFCMKKRGHQPTGNLVHAAKANGFASVSDMLHLKNSESSGSKETTDTAVSSKKQKVADKESGVKIASKSRKGSSFKGPNGSTQANDERTATRNTRLTRSRNKNSSKEIASDGNYGDFSTQKISPKKYQISREASYKGEVICKGNDAIQLLDTMLHKKCDHGEDEELNNADPVAKNKPTSKSPNRKKKNVKVKSKTSDAEILLPQGISLNSIAAIDLPVEDIGHALQFLEFCEAFGKVLNMRKGQSQLLLRELVTGKSKRRHSHSSIVQFHIQLLSVMQKDSVKEYPCLNQNLSENSWLQVLREYISDSRYALKQQLLDCLDVCDDGYEQLDSSKKLRLLNFLCDEALGTTDFRSWIDEEHSKFVEKEKKAKEELLARRDKERNLEKEMKRKLQDEIAEAILMKNGAPLTISENEDLVSKIKSEVAQTLEVAHTLASALEMSEMVIEEDWRSDAIRSEPIFWDGHGHKFEKFWRLRGYSGETDILLQDIEGRDLVTAKERWYTYSTEQKAMVDKYISSFRMQRK
ncbi:uncharacterized protein LOC110422844 isoform X2 [Herrania umbratica]|uniref:Uncharacterized protein LOC110422844 isoform X2 n=1 Tax=Herrania umbratica TaxID=108875 RepID=A0A6J1B063_9ROSI|nr:uncharacterized protein LOC110422844 isoform X2 [Herrania umbratica]